MSGFTFIFHFHALEKKMATHSSVLAWRIPGTEEPGGLPSMGSHRVRHDWSDLAAAATAATILHSSETCIYKKSRSVRQMHIDTHRFLSSIFSFVWMYYNLCIHSCVDGMTMLLAQSCPCLHGHLWAGFYRAHSEEKHCWVTRGACPQLYPDCWIMIQSGCTNSHAHESIFLRFQFPNTNPCLFRCWLLLEDVLCCQACLRVSSGICWFKGWGCDPQLFKRFPLSPTLELFLS